MAKKERVIYTRDTLYQHVTVAEDASKRMRYLYTSCRDEKQGALYLDAPLELVFEYCRVSFAALAFLEHAPQEALFIGLGAGSMPQYFAHYYPRARVDVVEVDPEVVAIARRFFGLRETGNLRVHVADGRRFVKRSRRRYDLIFFDAYQRADIPCHLITREALGELRDRLAPGGVLAANVLARDRGGFFASVSDTYREVFPYVFVFRGVETFNNVMMAMTHPVEKEQAKARARELQKQKRFSVRLDRLLSRHFYRPRASRKGRVLSDEGIAVLR